MATEEYETISIDRLCVGLYVRLDLSWLDHPFPTNTFKIRDSKQLATLRRLGLKEIRYIPAKSDCPPQAPGMPPAATPPADPQEDAQQQALQEAKKARIARLERQRAAVIECEKRLLEAASVVKEVNHNIYSSPKESIAAAEALIGQMADSMLQNKDVAIHALNDKVAGEEVYFHSLNVSVLSMILAKESGKPREFIEQIGMFGLLHDIGKLEIPDRIIKKIEPLNQAELHFLQEHSAYGEQIARKAGLPEEICIAIRQHHEHMDGSGYPDGLSGEGIRELARMLAIPNIYDNHCNHINPLTSLTPFEALSQMFSKQRPHFDPVPLNQFIRCMGVYPPGTIVRLSNETVGLVVSVNTSKALKPSIMIYDAEIPKDEAIILDLADEPDINISKSIPPAQLSREIYDYLSPRKRVTYYFDDAAKTAKPNS